MSFIEGLARRHNVKAEYKSISGEDAFVMGDMIFLNPDLYPPRMNWKFCHELSRILLGHTTSGSITREMEFEAEKKASELMLDPAEFNHLVGGHNMVELKNLFPHASWEVIARRIAEVTPAVLTIYDNRKLRSRSAADSMNYPPKPTQLEAELARECYQQKSHKSASQAGLWVSGYYIDENNAVKRVILLTTVNPDDGNY